MLKLVSLFQYSATLSCMRTACTQVMVAAGVGVTGLAAVDQLECRKAWQWAAWIKTVVTPA